MGRPGPNRLEEILAARIRSDGPIPVSTFMAEALGHPEHGYYTTREPFGRGGDFTTAPEISQMFGELIGLWAAVTWQCLGMPDRVILAEMGPGRGTLMADLLRAARAAPPFLAAAEIWLVETSPRLREHQRQTLAGHRVQWCEGFEDLPDGPMILVANELFDALPIRQFAKVAGQWHERMVGLDADDSLTFVVDPAIAAPDLPADILDAPDGAMVEISDAGRSLAAAIGRRFNRQPGVALVIDYGPARSGIGDSLQAVRQHRFHPVLDTPGEADLTAHVDFEALATAAVPARTWGAIAQGLFLQSLGIQSRAATLAHGKDAKTTEQITSQMRRLIAPDEMGTLFKVIAIASPILAAPAGFAA